MKIIAANWKMNHGFEEADNWIDNFFLGFSDHYEEIKDVEAVLCPPAIFLDHIDADLINDGFEYLEEVMKHDGKDFEDFSSEELNDLIIDNRPVKLGGQDCHFADSGSFTGNISPSMLRKVGCEYVILGHSERRLGNSESDEIVAKKIKAAIDAGLTPIICVGESKEVRDANGHLDFIRKQVASSIPQGLEFETLVIAYEPIWAIGTGVTPSIEQITEVSNLFSEIFDNELADRADDYFLLYGGSVNSQNAGEILKVEGINGLLVGGASLDAEEFVKICCS